MTRLLIIGGSDAGISAGLRARELAPETQVTLVLADAFANYSICGLPFYISGETPDWHQLAHRNQAELESAGLNLLMNHRAQAIDGPRKAVSLVDRAGVRSEVGYDTLIIATGAEPIRPPIEGLELEGVHVLHTMEDSFVVHDQVVERKPRKALIVGGGYIGLEMADALSHRGVGVTLVEQLPTVMPTVDGELGQIVAEELRRHGVAVTNDVAVEAIERVGDGLRVRGSSGFLAEADIVLVVVGVRPNAELAKTVGVETGLKGAIRVSRRMETNVNAIFAAGDCVETWHRLLQRPRYLPLGTTAHKQGRVAGENAVGRNAEFEGSLGTQVVKVFELAIARTGLSDEDADSFEPLTVESRVWDHKAYYPGARQLTIRVTGDRATGALLGAQIVGDYRGQIAKRIDIFATALFHGMAVDELNDLDLSYTPPFSAPWDPVQVAAQEWVARARVSSEYRSEARP